LLLQSVWHIKNTKGTAQGREKILTKYYATRRKLIKAGLLGVQANTTVHATANCKFCFLHNYKYTGYM